MRVTHKLVAGAIDNLFTCTPQVYEDYVAFGFSNDVFVAEVIINLVEIVEETEVESLRQAAQVTFWFSYDKDSRLNLSKLSFGEVLELFHRLQDELQWGVLYPVLVNDETIEAAIYRTVDIDVREIQKLYEKDSDSTLFRTLERLSDEWERLHPVLLGVANGDFQSLDCLEIFLQDLGTLN